MAKSTRPAPFDPMAYLLKDDVLKIRPSTEFHSKYQILRPLGNGAYSNVSLIEDRTEHDQYAAKTIVRSAVRDAKELWDQLRILTPLSHPSILAMRAIYSDADHLILVVDYAKNGDLCDWITNESQFNESSVCQIIKSITETVSYLHDRKVGHRDIKPENVMFTDSGASQVQLADLGLSGILTCNALLTSCSGSPCFAAPEVIKGTDPGLEADLWSIGVLTYFLLSGRLPFEGETLFQQYQKITTATIEFGTEFDNISDAAKDFIRAMIVADPKGRLIAKQAVKHAWFSDLEERGPGVEIPRERILAELQKRRQLKKYDPAQVDSEEVPE
jgi:serine/threonine protein kinase